MAALDGGFGAIRDADEEVRGQFETEAVSILVFSSVSVASTTPSGARGMVQLCLRGALACHSHALCRCGVRELPPPLSSQVRASVATKLGACETLSVVRYRTQVVAGTNFKVHAKVDGKEVIITAFRPLPHAGTGIEVKEVVEGTEL